MSLQAGDHIHANEVILTFGMSNTTLLFLKEAAKKRDFQVRHDRLVQDALHMLMHGSYSLENECKCVQCMICGVVSDSLRQSAPLHNSLECSKITQERTGMRMCTSVCMIL